MRLPEKLDVICQVLLPKHQVLNICDPEASDYAEGTFSEKLNPV